MNEMDDLNIKEEIDEISKRIDSIVQRIEQVVPDQPNSEDAQN